MRRGARTRNQQMALKANVFNEAFSELIDRLAMLTHYQGFVRWQLAQAKAGIARSLEHFEKKGWDKKAYFTFHGFGVVNVFHDGQFVIRNPAGGRLTQGEDLLLMSDEMERKFNSFMLVYGFEEFERFLKTAFGLFLYEIRGTRIDTKHFHKSVPKAVKSAGTQPYFAEYARWACNRSCDPALDLFAKELDLGSIIVMFCDLPVVDFIRVIAFCRHCVVHNGGRATERQLSKLSSDQRATVRLLMHNTLHGNEVAILPSTTDADNVVTSLASYGWAFYVLLAKRCGMKDDSTYFRSADGKRAVKPH